jgi:hypothetical protein
MGFSAIMAVIHGKYRVSPAMKMPSESFFQESFGPPVNVLPIERLGDWFNLVTSHCVCQSFSDDEVSRSQHPWKLSQSAGIDCPVFKMLKHRVVEV